VRTDTEPSTLRVYISEHVLNERTPPVDALRNELFQTVAMVELLVQKCYEPLDLSSLCVTRPFDRLDTTFRLLLRSVGTRDLLLQASHGLLLPGSRGKRLLNHYSSRVGPDAIQESGYSEDPGAGHQQVPGHAAFPRGESADPWRLPMLVAWARSHRYAAIEHSHPRLGRMLCTLGKPVEKR
jgi:hypothetical protein